MQQLLPHPGAHPAATTPSIFQKMTNGGKQPKIPLLNFFPSSCEPNLFSDSISPHADTEQGTVPAHGNANPVGFRGNSPPTPEWEISRSPRNGGFNENHVGRGGNAKAKSLGVAE